MQVFYNEEKGKIYMVLEYCCAVLKDMLDQVQVSISDPTKNHEKFSKKTRI